MWFRIVLHFATVLLVVLVATVALLHFRQHSMIYHPRPYDATYAHALPARGMEIDYTVPAGKQTAYYLPGTTAVPKRLWLAFCGNGSLALDWTTILRGHPQTEDAFLLVDYPGYGKNAGYATIESTRATADAALHALNERLHATEERPVLCLIGHSLGAAAALDFAAGHRVERLVAIAPFTTLREEAATVVGRPLARLLAEGYDNRKSLREAFQRNPGMRVWIFHGTNDNVIPLRLGRDLAQQFPRIAFWPVPGADHVSVLEKARAQIIACMEE